MLVRAAIVWTLAMVPNVATAAGWKSQLKANIESTFKLCKLRLGGAFAADSSTITKPGTQLVISAEGIAGDTASNLTGPFTVVQDGQTNVPRFGLSDAFRNDASIRQFKIGERVFLYDLDVKNDHQLLLSLISCDKFEVTVKGSTQYVRYVGRLRFEFPRNYLPTASFTDIRSAIEAIIAPGGTQTVSLGQSPEQVQAILGKPENIIDLGQRVVYVYKDVKIIFQDRKVTDVQ